MKYAHVAIFFIKLSFTPQEGNNCIINDACYKISKVALFPFINEWVTTTRNNKSLIIIFLALISFDHLVLISFSKYSIQ